MRRSSTVTSGTSSVTIANSGAAIDPSLATNATGQTTVQYRCTKGETPTTTANDGLNEGGTGSRRVRLGATAEYMPYALVLSGGDTVGSGHTAAASTLTIDATITAANHQNAAAGAYSDTVLISITP